MKNIKTEIIKAGFIVTTAVLVSSCSVRKEYQRPPAVVDENLYRTDKLPADSISFGAVSWREIFTDQILQNYIETALENNLDIRIALQNISSAEAYLKQSKAAYFPTLSVGPGYTFQTQSTNTQFGQIIGERRYVNQFDISGNASWEVDIWGRLKAQERAQYASYLGTVEAHRAVKSDLVSSIANAYFQILALDDQKKIITKTIKIREDNLQITQALKEAGTLTEVAVQQSTALVFNAQALLIDIETQIQQLENTISLLKGENPVAIARTTLAQQKIPGTVNTGFPAQLLANRPDVREAEYRVINAFELKNAAIAQFYPTLRLTAGTGLQSVDIDRLFSVNSIFASVVGGLVQPIFNRRQIRTNYEASIINQQTAYLQFRKAVLTAGKEVSDALRIFTVQDEFIALKSKELDAYSKSVTYSQELVNYGMANYLEVLNANVNALNAELTISNAQYIKLRAAVNLYNALGGGWQ